MEENKMMLNETYTLSNGVKIPKLGLGTWFIDDDKAEDAVKEAVKLGYRLIDTAQAYGNECGVGEGVRNCGLPRNEIFVTSKVAAEAKSYESAAASIDETLSKMGLDYIDMMIIHSPQPWAEFRIEKRYFKENKEVWRALEDAYTAGKIKAIGVSNFLQDDLENILADCKIKPMVNQILLHISNTNTELVDFCNKNGILVEAYSPIAHGEALKNDAITAMAKKYGVSTAQLCIRYVIQLGTVALPKTGNPVHMKDNANVDFEISDEDMKALKEMEHIDNYGEFNVFPVFSGKPLA
jgi:diketogulonate reductase-like aldo/keto reductase